MQEGLFMFGPFDELFDLNHDGKLNALEKAGELGFIKTLFENETDDSDDKDEDWKVKTGRSFN